MIPAKEAKEMLYMLLSENLVQLQVVATRERPLLSRLTPPRHSCLSL